MLHEAEKLNGYKLYSLDGIIGKVKEFYFDDRHWAIRYLVAECGSWLKERQVLISPYAMTAVMDKEKQIAVNLTKKQIEAGPSLDTDKPVSRQFEEEYFGYYGWPIYWGGPFMWGYFPYIVRESVLWKNSIQKKNKWNPHLRSMNSVTGFHIQAIDGEIGHVDDFIIDDETWAIRYLVINTHIWWPGNKVLISPRFIEKISWSDSTVMINRHRESIKCSLQFTPESIIPRDYEFELYAPNDLKGYPADENKLIKRAPMFA